MLVTNSDFLKNLTEERVYLYYDCPLLYICESKTGIKYLANCINKTETALTYSFLPISDKRIAEYESNIISLRNCYLQAEDSWFFQVDIPFNGEEPKVIFRYVTTLTEDELPDEDSYYDKDNNAGKSITDLLHIMQQEDRNGDWVQWGKEIEKGESEFDKELVKKTLTEWYKSYNNPMYLKLLEELEKI